MSKISEIVKKNINDKEWLTRMLPFSENKVVFLLVIKKYHSTDPSFLINLLSKKKSSLKEEYNYYINDLKGNDETLIKFFEEKCLSEIEESEIEESEIEESEESEIKTPEESEESEIESQETYYY